MPASIDFETYSEAGYVWDPVEKSWGPPPGAAESGLSLVGTVAYVAHPTFEVLCLAYDLGQGDGPRCWDPTQPPPIDLLEYVRGGGPVTGWNLEFELEGWNEYCSKVFGWPPLQPDQCFCSMAAARAFALPGKLDEAAKALRTDQQKDPEGAKLLKKFSVPRNPTKKDPRLRHLPSDFPQEFQRLKAYCVQDILTEQSIAAHIPPLPDSEREVWQAHVRINRRGMAVDLPLIDKFISIVEQAYARDNRRLEEITGGAVTKATQRDKLLDWLKSVGSPLPDAREETVEYFLKNKLINGLAKEAIEIRQRIASASVKKLYAMKYRAHGGRIHGLYAYHAARTGRWTAMGPQPQNFPRPLPEFEKVEDVERALGAIRLGSLELLEEAYPHLNAFDVLTSCLRALIVAGPGNELVNSDFTSIEAVVLACLAVVPWRIELFREGGKLYETSASKAFHVPLEEFEEYVRKNGKPHPLRQKGKGLELACGYGGWIAAARNFGVEGTDEELKEMVLAWRAASPELKEFWGGQTRGSFRYARPELFGLEGMSIAALRNPGTVFWVGQIAFVAEGTKYLFVRLPSGRFLTYHRPRLEPSIKEWAKPWELNLTYEGYNTNPKNGPIGWIRMSLYGGKWAENIVQAVSADFQRIALVEAERCGYPIVLHSHDEPMAEVPKGAGNMEEFERACTRLPDWARFEDGSPWPIKMGGAWIRDRYGK